MRRLLLRHPDCYQGALMLSPGGTGPPEEQVTPIVLREDPAFLTALQAKRPFHGLFVVRTLPVLDIVRQQALPGVLGADHEFLSRIEQGPDFA